MEIVTSIFVLLVLYQLKHFICDYPLQNVYMLGKFKDIGWVKPLLAHTGVHALATFIIAISFTQMLFLSVCLALFDMAVHFVMDRVKASPNMLGRYDIKDKRFWWSLGLDQMVHHLTHYAIIACIVLI
jgi:hypothetical protein